MAVRDRYINVVKPYSHRYCECLEWQLSRITVLYIITAELGRALDVVKVTFQVNGSSQFLGVCPQKLLGR